MSFGMVSVALIWGAVFGYAVLRIIESLVALVICLHGFTLSVRRKGKSRKRAGGVSPRIIRKLAFHIGLYLILFACVAYLGNSFVQRQLGFDYGGNAVTVWIVTAGCIFLLRLRTSLRRIALIHRLSHEEGYAERRDRTLLLRK